MTIKPLSALVGCLLSLCAYGQDGSMGQVRPDGKMEPGASPTGSGLGSLYTPNLYDGSTNISIPIYQYEAEGASYGVSFGYNTKGIRVNEISSQIGLHFTLNTSGSISRVVKDLPDELQVTTPTEQIVLPPGEAVVDNPYTKFKGRYVTFFESAADAADTRTYRDRESDDFIVFAGNMSFTFNLQSKTAFYTNPKKNVKIEVLLDGSPVTSISNTQLIGSSSGSLILGFTITDEGGNKYYFERGDYFSRKILDQYADGELATYYYTTKWDLARVVLASGQEIRYDYSTMYVNQPDYYASQMKEWPTTSVSPSSGPVYSYGTYSRLDSISYPDNIKVRFSYDAAIRCDLRTNGTLPTNAGALRQISVGGDGNCLNYILDQAYFVSPYTGGTLAETPYGSCLSIGGDLDQSARHHRLKLKGIKIRSCDGTVEEPYYTFDYESQQLPVRMHGAQDYFGYYNGKVPTGVKENTVPSHNRFDGTGPLLTYADKTPDAAYAKACLLNKVTNAYGGYISFAYGPHELVSVPLSGQPTDNLFMGKGAGDGVRLLSVTEGDSYHPDNTKITSFTYSEGQCFLDGGYFHYKSTMIDGGTTASEITMTGQYLSPHQLVNGSNHGYGQVMVAVKMNGTDLLSRRLLTFTNFKDATSGNIARYQLSSGSKNYWEFPYADKQYLRDWEMGLPLSITEYNENDRIVQQTTNYYRFTSENSAITNTKAANVLRKDVYVHPDGDALAKREFTDVYKPYRGKAFLDSTVTLKYVADSRYIADTTRYTYDSKDNIKSIIARNSFGDRVHSINYYNYDGGTSTMPGIEKVVATQRWEQPAGTATAPPAAGTLLDAFFNTFAYEAIGTTGSRKIWPSSVYTLTAGEPLTPAAYTGSGSYVSTAQKINGAFAGATLPNFKEASRVQRYDARGNPLETKLQGQEVYKAMVWDTTRSQKLAEAANCRYTDIAYTSFENPLPASGDVLLATMTLGNTSYTIGRVKTVSGGALTGKLAYELTSSGLASENIFGTESLTVGKAYRLTFWAKGSVPRAYIGSTALTLTTLYDNALAGWKCYQALFTPAAAGVFSIKAAASGTSYVDDVRLTPADASMQSQTRESLFGISSGTDATGRVTYYEYDKLGRRVVVRDQERNILSKTDYKVQGAE